MSTTSDVKVVKIAQQLTSDTADRRISWEPSQTNLEEIYMTSVANAIIAIARSKNNGYFTLRILNSDRSIIETLAMTPESDASVDSLLEDLFHTARREALKVDETLDGILRALGN